MRTTLSHQSYSYDKIWLQMEGLSVICEVVNTKNNAVRILQIRYIFHLQTKSPSDQSEERSPDAQLKICFFLYGSPRWWIPFFEVVATHRKNIEVQLKHSPTKVLVSHEELLRWVGQRESWIWRPIQAADFYHSESSQTGICQDESSGLVHPFILFCYVFGYFPQALESMKVEIFRFTD